MDWYLWVFIGLIGIVVTVLLLGLVVLLFVAIASAFMFAGIMALTVSYTATYLIAAIYWPQKGKKWLRHGWFLNIVKIVFSPFGFASIPIAYVESKLIGKIGYG